MIQFQNSMVKKPKNKTNTILIIGCTFIGAVIIGMIVMATIAGSQYFYTVDEILKSKDQLQGTVVRISGAVVGESIQYDPATFTLKFQIANISGTLKEIEKEGGLADALHNAVKDPSRSRLLIIYQGVKPDLLKNEAQAIIKGELGKNDEFTASEILLKCPSKYSEDIPNQAGQ
jgi:cytochrome c-type biogenesis protein CcmE